MLCHGRLFQQNRSLHLVTISSPSNLTENKRLKCILICGRIHPAETASSFVLQGLIEFLISSHFLAATLRDYVIFKILPMINPDGVFVGNSRTSIMGFDLNRSWAENSEWAHPTIHRTVELLKELNGHELIEMDHCIDVHANSTTLGLFTIGNAYDDVYRLEKHILLPKLFDQCAYDFNLTKCLYTKDPTRKSMTRRFMTSVLEESVNCYTLEVSYLGYQQPNESSFIAYTEESYMRIGRNMARTFLEYYRSIGMIQNVVNIESFLFPDMKPLTRARRDSKLIIIKNMRQSISCLKNQNKFSIITEGNKKNIKRDSSVSSTEINNKSEEQNIRDEFQECGKKRNVFHLLNSNVNFEIKNNKHSTNFDDSKLKKDISDSCINEAKVADNIAVKLPEEKALNNVRKELHIKEKNRNKKYLQSKNNDPYQHSNQDLLRDINLKPESCIVLVSSKTEKHTYKSQIGNLQVSYKHYGVQNSCEPFASVNSENEISSKKFQHCKKLPNNFIKYIHNKNKAQFPLLNDDYFKSGRYYWLPEISRNSKHADEGILKIIDMNKLIRISINKAEEKNLK